MFQKTINNFKVFWRSSSAIPVLISFFLGIASSIGAIFSNLAIFPIISGASLILLLSFLIISQGKVADLKIRKGLEPEHLRAITKNMKEAVIIYDPDFKVLDFNPAAENIFKIKRKEIINARLSPSFVKNEKFKSLAQVIFPSLAPRVVQTSERGWPQTTEISTENGLSLISVLARTTDQNQNSTSFIKIIQNKTKERNLAEARADFITTSTQQTQAPLRKVNKILKEMKEEAENNSKPDPEKMAEGIRLSHEILEITKNLSEAAKLEDNQNLYDFQKINLAALVKKIAEKAEDIADDYEISMSVSCPDNVAVRADSQKITAVLSVLIDNAIKYNNKGGSVDVSVSLQEDFAEVTVSDTGLGIEKKELDKIFNKFYRTQRGTRLIPGGTGLGLYIARKIIEKHGGRIWVESVPERGSVFHFTLPLIK